MKYTDINDFKLSILEASFLSGFTSLLMASSLNTVVMAWSIAGHTSVLAVVI